jgi:alpha-L-fucosidase
MRERRLPAWYDDAKLGMFIHWSAAAIPAFAPVPDRIRFSDPLFQVNLPFAEMYQNTMGIPDSPTARHHADRHGDLSYDEFVYELRDRVIPAWDPEPWAQLAEQAGARYVVLATKLEDGFLLWPSAHVNPRKAGWQSGRDVVGELAAAVRARGMAFGTYYSHLDWTFTLPPLMDEEAFENATDDSDEYVAYVSAHWRELIERYRPDVLWGDYPLSRKVDLARVMQLYAERVPEGVVNDRFDDGEDSRSASGELRRDYLVYECPNDYSGIAIDEKWEAAQPIGTSFGFNRQETDATYKSPTRLVQELIEIVARGGNLLLNLGPTGAGQVAWDQATRLIAIGWWLRRHGGAIYGTRRWERATGGTADGLEVRYTVSDDAVHAIVLGTPPDAHVELDVRLEPGAEVTIEGRPVALPWQSSPFGTRIDLPEAPDEQPAMALRISPAGAVGRRDQPLRPRA